MTQTTTEPVKGSSINPLENLDGWLKQELDATAATGTPDATAAEPTAAVEPPVDAQPSTGSWRKQILDDVDHGFFKGKPAEQLYESYQHAERAKQQAETRANELARELEALRRQTEADAAVKRALGQAAPSVQQQNDPLAEIESLWFENPRQAAAKLSEQIAAEARQLAAQEASRINQQSAQESARQNAVARGEHAFESARQALGVESDLWLKRGKAVLVEVTDPRGVYYENGGPLNAENLKAAYTDLFGAPTQAATATVPPAVTTIPNPPGAKKPAAASAPAATGSPISEEQRQAWASVAGIAGIPVETFIKKMEKSRG